MRYIGASLIFLSAFFCGILAGKRERRRVLECEAFLSLFEYVKNQVGYFLMPTKQIYRGFENAVLSETGFLGELCSHEEDDVYYGAWEAALLKCGDKLSLSQEEKKLVLEFGACIGKSDEHMQIKSFDYYIKQMSAEIERARMEAEKNIRVYRTIGFTIGAMAAILII